MNKKIEDRLKITEALVARTTAHLAAVEKRLERDKEIIAQQQKYIEELKDYLQSIDTQNPFKT